MLGATKAKNRFRKAKICWDDIFSLKEVKPRRSANITLFSLVAAALEDRTIAGAMLHDTFRSLKEIITQNQAADKMPEMFCFGLLESFDVPQLIALCAPRKVEMP
jgi:hypothetical protein